MAYRKRPLNIARIPDGDLHSPWVAYSAFPVDKPFIDKLGRYQTREWAKDKLAEYEQWLNDVKVIGRDDEDCTVFSIQSKLTRRWYTVAYRESSIIHEYLYNRAVGKSNNVNLRRCFWGSLECEDCLECVAGIDSYEEL